MTTILSVFCILCCFLMAGNSAAQVVGLEREKEFVFKNTFHSAEFPDGVIKSGTSVNYYERFYDDWVAENYAAWQMAGNMNAVKFSFPPYPLTIVGANIYVGNGSFPAGGNILNQPFRISVYADDGENGMPGTLIDSISALATNYEWVSVIGLNATVTSDFYMVMTQLSNAPDCVPIGVDETLPKANRSYSRNIMIGNPWALSPYQDFMIHVYISGTVGFEERENAEAVRIFPNPANETVNLSLPPQIKSISVFSASGQKVFQDNTARLSTFSINTSFYLSGVYYIRFNTSKGDSFIRKLVVVH